MKLQQPMSLCFENTSAFRFKTAPNDSKSPSPIFHLKCFISGKTGWSDSSSYNEKRYGKFEQLDKPSSVSDFIENSLLIDLNSSILFKIFILISKIRAVFHTISLRVLCLLIVVFHRQSVTLFLSTLNRKHGVQCVQQHTGTQPVSCYGKAPA